MEVKLLKLTKRREILMLALLKRITQRKTAAELALPLSHTKLLVRRFNWSGFANLDCVLSLRVVTATRVESSTPMCP